MRNKARNKKKKKKKIRISGGNEKKEMDVLRPVKDVEREGGSISKTPRTPLPAPGRWRSSERKVRWDNS
jgi:hypothetical protein